MKLIVGLGNIGREYENTRHNIGFMVVDELAKRLGVSFDKEERSAYCAEYRAPEKILLIKPTTYMNLSGFAVGAYANFYHLAPENIAVVQDDMDLPVGQLRIRRKGSAGGHNGIKSITEHLGTAEFPRFKIGIGHPERNSKAVINHVLHQFQGEDKANIEAAVKEMSDALEEWLKGAELDDVMTRHNTKKKK
jgi:PTH1 family peptidyl-tRNA hydrolase